MSIQNETAKMLTVDSKIKVSKRNKRLLIDNRRYYDTKKIGLRYRNGRITGYSI